MERTNELSKNASEQIQLSGQNDYDGFAPRIRSTSP